MTNKFVLVFHCAFLPGTIAVGEINLYVVHTAHSQACGYVEVSRKLAAIVSGYGFQVLTITIKHSYDILGNRQRFLAERQLLHHHEVGHSLYNHKDVIDYEHFSVPYILTVDEILAKIHNLTLREMPGGTLFPDTMKQYDDYTIREALHNCIAHSNYQLQQRINFVENPGFLYYSNAGSFIPGSLEEVLSTDEPQKFFRNDCLCQAMVHFNMIDTVSRGIKKMFTEQWQRRFPMPDYEIDNDKQHVAVRIYGTSIDERYTNMLKNNDSLTLWDCISLDAIQKGHRIDETVAQDMIQRGLIEGEAPNYTISLSVAKASRQLPEYTKAKGLDKARLKQMVLQLLQNAGKDGARREIIYDYLRDLLPSNKSQEQQLRYLGRLLVEMNEEGTIGRIGLRWLLSSPSDRKQP